MTRTSRFRTVCRVLALMFILIAAARLATSAVPLFDPLLGTPPLGCDNCGFRKDPVMLLEPETERKRAWQTPGSEAHILQQLQLPKVRVMLFTANMVSALPFFVLFLGLAMALKSFASGGFNRTAVRWLRRSALASIFWALSHPIAQSIRWTAFSPVTHGEELRHVVIDLNHLLWPALLSGAVWVCVWALEEALTIQQDLEDYV